MTPRRIRVAIVIEKIGYVRNMIAQLRNLPIESFEEFVSDKRNPLAAESCLRRALEGVLDIGRHILAKGFGEGTLEYKQVVRRLSYHKVLSLELGDRLTEMAGYRNRLVHFYDEVTNEELYTICTERVSEIEAVIDEILAWLRSHPKMLDKEL